MLEIIICCFCLMPYSQKKKGRRNCIFYCVPTLLFCYSYQHLFLLFSHIFSNNKLSIISHNNNNYYFNLIQEVIINNRKKKKRRIFLSSSSYYKYPPHHPPPPSPSHCASFFLIFSSFHLVDRQRTSHIAAAGA